MNIADPSRVVDGPGLDAVVVIEGGRCAAGKRGARVGCTLPALSTARLCRRAGARSSATVCGNARAQRFGLALQVGFGPGAAAVGAHLHGAYGPMPGPGEARDLVDAFLRQMHPPEGEVISDFTSMRRENWRAAVGHQIRVLARFFARLRGLRGDLQRAQPFHAEIALAAGHEQAHREALAGRIGSPFW